ncbi:MAG: hypothetical protein H7836_11395 [Magnetococcus sp. YQC-3]
MFIIIIMIFSSFFVVGEDNELGLSDSWVIESPFRGTIIMENNTEYVYNTTSGQYEPKIKGPDYGEILQGVGLILGGVALTLLTLGSGTPFTIPIILGAGIALTAGVSRVSEGAVGKSVINTIPVLGPINAALDYSASALVSFMDLAGFTVTLLLQYPMVLWAFSSVIGFVFFVFIIRYIRGQG